MMAEVEAALAWVRESETLLATGALLSIVTFVGTLVAMPILIARIPPDYFARESVLFSGRRNRPWVWLSLVGKNLLGLVLVVMGVLMLVLPGQGILTILIGLSLIDFPGRRRLELRLARSRQVRRVIGWIRRRAGSPPLVYPDEV